MEVIRTVETVAEALASTRKAPVARPQTSATIAADL
jgi:hypothetical protein